MPTRDIFLVVLCLKRVSSPMHSNAMTSFCNLFNALTMTMPAGSCESMEPCINHEADSLQFAPSLSMRYNKLNANYFVS
jgi:hypothetical protein